MKKIAGKIAVILVLVMLANSFTGCSAVFKGERWAEAFDMVLLVSLLVVVGAMTLFMTEAEPPNEAETGIFLTGAGSNYLIDYYPVLEIINSLSETERSSLMEKYYSLSETKQASLVKTINSLPKSEIASSMNKLKALSDKELSLTIRNFNTLSEEEIDFLMKELNEKTKSVLEVAYADTVNSSYQKPYMGTRLCLQY